MLKASVKTRHVLREDIKYFSNLFNIDINIAHRKVDTDLKDKDNGTNIYYNGVPYKVKDYEKLNSSNRRIILILLTFFEEFEHYMLNDNIPEYLVNELFEKGRRVNITMILI